MSLTSLRLRNGVGRSALRFAHAPPLWIGAAAAASCSSSSGACANGGRGYASARQPLLRGPSPSRGVATIRRADSATSSNLSNLSGGSNITCSCHLSLPARAFGMRGLNTTASAASDASDWQSPLAVRLRELRSRAGVTAAEIESAVGAHPDGVQTVGELSVYLGCYADAGAPTGAAAALRTFERAVRMPAQCNAGSLPLLAQCVARDWRPEYLPRLRVLRERLLSFDPPQRLTIRVVDKLVALAQASPAAARLVMLWAKEDDAWTAAPMAVRTAIRDATKASAHAARRAASMPPPPRPQPPQPQPQPLQSRRSNARPNVEAQVQQAAAAAQTMGVLQALVAASAAAVTTPIAAAAGSSRSAPNKFNAHSLLISRLNKPSLSWQQQHTRSLLTASLRSYPPPPSAPLPVAAPPPVVAAPAPSATSGGGPRTLKARLKSLHSRLFNESRGASNAPARTHTSSDATRIEATVVAGFGPGEWTIDSLMWYLRCYELVPGADAALRTFELVTTAHGVEPVSRLYVSLMRALCHDWRAEHADTLDALRARMLAHAPPLRFNTTGFAALIPSFSAHEEAAKCLRLWADQEGAWASLGHELQQRLLHPGPQPHRARRPLATKAKPAASSGSRSALAIGAHPAPKPVVEDPSSRGPVSQMAVLLGASDAFVFATSSARRLLSRARTQELASSSPSSTQRTMDAARALRTEAATAAAAVSARNSASTPIPAHRSRSVPSTRPPAAATAAAASLPPPASTVASARSKANKAPMPQADNSPVANVTGVAAAAAAAAPTLAPSIAAAPPLDLLRVQRAAAVADFVASLAPASKSGASGASRSSGGRTAHLAQLLHGTSSAAAEVESNPATGEDAPALSASVAAPNPATSTSEAATPALEPVVAGAVSASASTSASALTTAQAALVKGLNAQLRHKHMGYANAVVASVPDDAWSIEALHVYLQCCAHASDAVAALNMFKHVTISLGHAATAATFMRLLRALALDRHWGPSRLRTMDALRAMMQSQSPPLHFSVRHVVDLLPLLSIRAETRDRLRRWIEEDCVPHAGAGQAALAAQGRIEALAQHVVPSIAGTTKFFAQFIQLPLALQPAAAQPAAPAQPERPTTDDSDAALASAPASPSPSAPVPTTARQLSSRQQSLVKQLYALRSSTGFLDGQAVEAVVARFTPRAWGRPALHAYLSCYTSARGAHQSLRMFERVTGELGVHANASTFALLMCALARDWSAHHEHELDSLRLRMQLAAPPLRFDPAHVGLMLPMLRRHLPAAARLHHWAQEDGVWDALSPSLRQGLLHAVDQHIDGAPSQTSHVHVDVDEAATNGTVDDNHSHDTSNVNGNSGSGSIDPKDEGASASLLSLREVLSLAARPSPSSSSSSSMHQSRS